MSRMRPWLAFSPELGLKRKQKRRRNNLRRSRLYSPPLEGESSAQSPRQGSLAPLLLLRLLRRRTCTIRAEKELASISEREIPAISFQAAIFGLITSDNNGCSR